MVAKKSKKKRGTLKPRKRVELLERDLAIWELTKESISQAKIGETLGINRATINRSLKKIFVRYEKAFMESVNETKLQQAAQIEHAAVRAMEEYEKSAEYEAVTKDGDVVQLTQACNPKHLDTFLRCKEHIRKILGADVKRIQTVAEQTPFGSLTLDQRIAEFDRLPLSERVELLNKMLKPS
jgi:hypothetical protein